MKIAHIIDSMGVGGAETMVLALSRYQQLLNHNVSVHCLFGAGTLAADLSQFGISLVNHCPRPELGQDFGYRAQLRLAASLYRNFRKFRPDVVHCHNLFATIVGAPAARLAGVKTAISTRHGLVDQIQNAVHERRFWLAARSTKRVVAVCQTAEHNLALCPLAAPTKLITIKNGASPAVCDGTTEMIPKKGLTAITVARLAPPKDHATLLEAMTHVPDINLWIVGDGQLSGTLGTMAANSGLQSRVTFLGERRNVGSYLAAADVFVLSSLSEGIPISLLEAMASRLPAVVTAVGGMEEVIKLSLAGILVPPRSPQPLAQALKEYAQKPAKRADHARLARLCYEHHFTFERMAEQYMNLYLS